MDRSLLAQSPRRSSFFQVQVLLFFSWFLIWKGPLCLRNGSDLRVCDRFCDRVRFFGSSSVFEQGQDLWKPRRGRRSGPLVEEAKKKNKHVQSQMTFTVRTPA